jgi:hypothetical protein
MKNLLFSKVKVTTLRSENEMKYVIIYRKSE